MTKPNWQPTKAELWHKLPAPARPWPSEVAVFQKYAAEKKALGKKDVLILGSTVEFRSLLHELGMNVHIADFSRSFYEILTKTQTEKLRHQGKEIFYEEDWREMDLGKQFDLIFGDWVPGVLHTADYGVFFRNIIRHLEEDGLFIARECLRPDNSEVDLESVLKRHYEKYAGQYSFYETSMQYVYAYRPYPENDMWNMPAARQALDHARVKGLFKKEEDYEFMKWALSFERDASASVMTQEDFDKKIKNYFNTVAKHHGNEPSSDWYPIYVLEKKYAENNRPQSALE